MIYHKVILNISNIKVYLIITDNFEKSINEFYLLKAFMQKLSKEKREEAMDSVAYTCSLNMKLGINDKYYVVMRPGVKNSDIAHESFHLALRILGFKSIINSEEIYAYMIQDIYERIEEQIIKYRNKEVIPNKNLKK